MFDTSFATKFTMDMMSLEAAMTIYEYEHGITPEYLESHNDEYDDDDCATESASGTFVDNLFEDDFAPATEGFKDTMSNIGKGIKNAAITVLGAIKKAFSTLGAKISSFFSGLIEGIQRSSARKDPMVLKILQNESVRKASREITDLFDQIGVQTAAANVKVLPIINKINKAFNSVGIGNDSKASVSKDDLKTMSDTFTGSYGTNGINKMKGKKYDSYKADNDSYADSDIAYAESLIKELQESMKKVQETIDGVKDDQTDAIKNSMKELINSEGDGNKETGLQEKRDGTVKATKGKKKVTPALVQKAMFINVNVSKIQSTSKKITAACSQHVKACEGLIGAAGKIKESNANDLAVKRGYRLCQFYMKASSIFSQLSLACTKIVSSKFTSLENFGDTKEEYDYED